MDLGSKPFPGSEHRAEHEHGAGYRCLRRPEEGELPPRER
jgi:hypothetical protein